MNVNFGLLVTMETERLLLGSVRATEEEFDRYVALYSDPGVMQKFADGQTKTKEQTTKRVQELAERWQKGDPYSALSVFKKRTGEFLGAVFLGHTGLPGVAELAGLGYEEFWGQGYGTEAALAIIEGYAPATVKKGYLLDGKPLQKITATARTDNPGSSRVLEKLGMRFVKEEERYGRTRRFYELELSQSKSCIDLVFACFARMLSVLSSFVYTPFANGACKRAHE